VNKKEGDVMFSKKVVVNNPTGLHARPAGQLSKICSRMPVDIKLIFGEKEINPKGVLAILTAGIKRGSEITVMTEGEEEGRYGEEIVNFINGLSE